MFVEFVVAFAIAALCAVIHITVLLSLVKRLLLRKEHYEGRAELRHFTPMLVFVFGVVLVLHVLEGLIWAVFYTAYNLFPDFESSVYFSLGTYTTIGYGDVVLPQTWRLVGALEGLSGVLLCGVSTAFLFAIINAIFRIRAEQANNAKELDYD